MEDQSNFNPQPIQPSLWKKYGRKTLLIIGGIIVAGAILVGTGGFEKLAHILGIKASTMQTIELFGEANLRGGADATEPHVETSTTATLTSADVVTSAAGVPAGDLPGLILPQGQGDVICPPEVECPSTTRRYVSPALNLGADANTLEAIRIQAFLPEGASMIFDYRTADTVANLETGEFSPIETLFDPAESPADQPVISHSTTTLPSIPVKKFLQVGVTFVGGGMLGPIKQLTPAVYGWSIDYAAVEVAGGDGTPGGDGGTGDNQPDPTDSRTIILHYDPTHVPANASIKLISADPAIPAQFLTASLDMTATNEVEFTLTNMAAGAYALDIAGEGYKDGVVALEASDLNPIELTLADMAPDDTCPAIEPPADGEQAHYSADINGDGKVSASDLTILLGQYGGNPE